MTTDDPNVIRLYALYKNWLPSIQRLLKSNYVARNAKKCCSLTYLSIQAKMLSLLLRRYGRDIGYFRPYAASAVDVE